MCSLEIIITCQIYNSLTSILNEAAFVSPSSVSCWVTDTSGGVGGWWCSKQILSTRDMIEDEYEHFVKPFAFVRRVMIQWKVSVRPVSLKAPDAAKHFTNHQKMNQPQWGNTRSALSKLFGLALGVFWHK